MSRSSQNRRVSAPLSQSASSAPLGSTSLLNQLLSLLLVYALLLQFIPAFNRVTLARTLPDRSAPARLNLLSKSVAEPERPEPSEPLAAPVPPASGETITDAVVTRHGPTLTNGRIEGSLRVLLGESFTITNATSITSDVYVPGNPSIQVGNGAEHGGLIDDAGAATPGGYTLTLANNATLPGRIHTHADAIELPAVAASVPQPTGTRVVTVSSQAEVATIGDWQTVRDLNVTGSHVTVDLPPGNYGTLTVNGNCQVNLSAGTYNFANTFNLDGSATLQATGSVVINVGTDLTINSGALTAGSYTAPADVRLNVLGSVVNINGSSQVTALISAYNAHAKLSGKSQVRGRVIVKTLTLSGGKVIGAVWPMVSGSQMTLFGPRRFDRTTSAPNQYVEQFSLPAGTTSPYTLHIQNGTVDGAYRVSSATVKLNGVSLFTQSDLNQNVASLDRPVTLAAQNQIDVSLASDPGSYLIINITGTIPATDTTPPLLAITSPANNSTTINNQISVSGTASDSGQNASGVAHVYVNEIEASYNTSAGTWVLANVPLAMGSNQIVVRAVDQAGNQTTLTITVTREAPENQPPTVDAGADQTITLPNTAALDGDAMDDGLPEGSSLTTTWSKVTGPGTVTFADANAVSTTASFSVHGTYVLRLSATDGQLTATDEVTIIVEPQNQPPTVSAGVDQTIALPSTATLNGTVTDDGLPAGSTVSSTWSLVSGPGNVTFADSSLTETVATFSAPGTYVLRLSATDGDLSSSSDVTITVHPENQAPAVNAGPDQTISLPANAQLNGTASDDGWPYGSTLSTTWTMVSGPGTVTFGTANVTVTTASFSTAGTYVLRLTASDGALSTADELTIVVTPPNQAPVVNAGPDQIISLPQNTVNLSGVVTDDGLPIGSTLAIAWTVIGGPAGATFGNPNLAATTAQFSSAGDYVLRLSATDGALSAFDDLLVRVTPPNQAPSVNAGADQTVVLPANAALNGTVSDDGLPLGSTLTTSWTKVSGPGEVTFANSTVTITTASFSAPGTYVLRLSASDSELTGSDDLTIVVTDPRVPPVANFIVPQTTGAAGGFVISTSGGTTPDSILDSNNATSWTTSGQTNQFAKVQFYDQQSIYIDRVRLQANQGLPGTNNVKDFEVQVSATTSDDQSFVSVLTATYVNNGQLQEFVFPGGPVRARFIKYLPKNNHAGSGNILTGTFNPVAVGSVDSLLSLPGDTNGARSQSPALFSNGGVIHSFSYGGGTNSANGLLGYFGGGWITTSTANQFAIVQLGGDAPVTIKGIKLATWFDSGSGRPTAVKDFQIWVSSTSTDATAFTQVLSASAPFAGSVQTYLFPGGPVSARYVKYVPLNNHGGGTGFNTPVFDVVIENGARVVGVSGENQNVPNPAEAAFDGDTNSQWFSPGSVVTNVWVKTALKDEVIQKLYGVRIAPSGNISLQQGPKDFDIRVSTTTTDDSAFTTIFSGTVATTTNGAAQEFLFPNPVDAKYVQFFWKNGYSTSTIGVRELEALIIPSRGSAIAAFSSQDEAASNCLDLDPSGQVWSTANGMTTNQWIKLLMPRGELANINHMALRPAIAGNTFYGAPKDFELQVSTTDANDSSFTTVLSGTFANNTQLQDFYFPTTQARYVKLLLKNNYQFSRIGVANFYVYAADEIGTTTRFFDQSTDADGPIVSWAWDFGDGGTSSERNPSHTYAQPGNYVVTLTVTDHTGLMSTRQTTYRVVDSLRASFTVSPMIAHEGGESVRFTDITRLLVNANAVRQYDFGDSSFLSQSANSSIHTYAENGTYHVAFRIGDALGTAFTATKDVIVLNVAPFVDIPNGKTVVWGESWTSVPTISDQSVTDRLTLQGLWDFGDGQTSQCVNCTNANATVTHAYATPGTYTATLSITDRDGDTGSDSATYIVNKRATSLTFQNNSLQAPGQFRSRAKLTDLFANIGVANRTIQFNVNGTSGTALTDANGIAEIVLPVASNATVANITASFASDSLYLASSNSASVTLNFAPVVNAGPDQATTFPCGVNLSGTATDDGVPSGSSLALTWSKVSGPGTVTFSAPTAVQTSATFTAAGKYVLRLSATDSQLTGSDDVTVTVNAGEVGQSLYFGPTPYLSFADSPISGRNTTYFYLEDFEDHLFNTPGVTASAGGVSSVVFGPNLHDSVDADDGVIDGSGLAGDSFFTANGPAGITFTFNAATLGRLPTYAGLVWTDGAGQVFFEAFAQNGVSMGVRGPYNFPDGSNAGTTAEDNFLGAYNRDGISAIKVWNTIGGMEIDHLQYSFATVNQPPVINAGPDQTVAIESGSVALNGAVSDDGLPACVTVTSTWTKVSGPGTVTFGNAQAPVTTVTLSQPGTYVLRLTATDTQYASSDDIVIQSVINQAPSVNAGADQTITLPHTANLNASVTDDGVPAAVTVTWSVVSGPGTVVFGDSHATTTSATFNLAGTYVLRIIASDSLLTASDDLAVIVNPEAVNQAPTVNAGSDQVATINGNLVINPGNEAELVNNEIPNWIEAQGSTWTRATASAGAEPQYGHAYFFAGDADQAELRQDIDVSAFAGSIAAGTQQFEFQVYLRSLAETVPDAGRVILEYRNANNTSVIATLDSGSISSTTGWQLTEDTRVVPQGTGWVRIRLIATRNSGATNDAFFDSVSLRPIGNAAVKLLGTATDDGLPSGSTLSTTWTTVSGPGAVTFANANSATTGASFVTPGTYVLRLTSSDGALSASDEVTVFVNPQNLAPVVNAGANQTITLPASANLNGTVSDDGQPAGSSVSVSWTKVSGPGTVTFADPNAAITTASFSVAGFYVLRLTADDTEYATASDVTITVNPAPDNNQPPAVNPGPNQTISLPTDTVTLNGTATDDGLPAGSTLVVTWSKVSGPGDVTFGNANSAVTTAQFSAVGDYVLRLSASDGAYLVSADVGVTLTPENHAPTVNAGADQTILLSQIAQLDGSVSDDGLPSGSLTTTWSKISGPGNVSFTNPNVTITGAQFSATGTYILRLTASDGALSASDDVTITVNDNVAPPAVEITSPADGSEFTEPSPVTGSVSNGAWVLEYSLNSDDGSNNQIWTTVNSGNGPVTNGPLGTLDTTLMLNGTYSLRLKATDEYGQISFTSIGVVVDKNFKVGQLQLAFSDMNVLVAGLPIEVIRSYDSRDKRVGDFGVGWQMGLRNARVEKTGVLGLSWFQTVSSGAIPTYCLEPSRPHKVTVTFGDGKVFKFLAATSIHCQQFAPVSSAQMTFTPQPGTHATLEVVGPNDILVESLGSIPGPARLLNQNNPDIFNSFTFRLTTAEGVSYVINQQTGVSSVADPYGNSLTISPGGVIHSSGKSITFVRDALGRITQITDPNGNSQSYEYDAHGDLVTFRDRENHATTFTYNSDHHLLTIVDARGVNLLTNQYDAAGRLLGQTDAFNQSLTYDHNIAARVETITDRLGHETRYEYDERGNVLRQVDARGGVNSFTYDALDNVLTETNELNKTTTYTYDAADNRTSITDPLNRVTNFTYNNARQVLTITDPRGKVTTNTYDAAGTNLLTTTDPLNNTTTFTYSIFTGQRTTMKDALNQLTSYEYDAAGRLSTETDALGHATTYGYDANGNRTSQTVKRTNAQGQLETITTTFIYDKLNRLTKTTFADGSFTQVEYNAIGQQSATIDQLGQRTEFTYDDMGRLTRTDYPDGTHDEATYDAEGRRLTSRDRAGHSTSFEYDELGRLTKTTYADNTFTSTSYDAAGQVLTTTDARGNVTHYFYDAAGRRTRVRNALDQETTFTYDANGNQLTMTDALLRTTTFEYDDNNRRVKTIYADNSFDTVAYDALGRSVLKTDQAGKTTQFFYDPLSRLTKVKDALNQETTYSYNELGQQLTQTDANNHTTRFEYDQLGRRVKRTLPAGQFETYSYNPGGNLESRTDFNGQTTTFTYDVMRRMLTKTPDASLNQPTISFTYYANGQRATMTDASGATVYTYDLRNRLAAKQTPFGTLSYTYDNSGNVLTTRSSNANGVSIDYAYDALNRLRTVKDNRLLAVNGGVTSYSYDDVGNLESYLYPNGVTTSYSYNTLNRLTSMSTAAGATTQSNYSYTLGPAGNRTAVSELSGRTVTYSYDDLYRLTNETIANDPHVINGSVNYNYDPVGNRLSRTSTVTGVPSQTSTFDANDRLNSDTYDANGNTTVSSSNTYAYDFENHLTSLNNGTATFIYDGDGNRISKTVSGVTTNYLVDTNNHTGYSQVVEELQSGAVTKQFTYGHDLISQRIIGGPLSFYSYDGHGSVRQLTDASASVTDTYDYDAFGILINRTGTTPNDYLYTGEQFDQQLGLYYHRARYFTMYRGRFLTSDSYEGLASEPISLHKYAYASNDPVNSIDPSGRLSIADAAITVGIIAIVVALAQAIPTLYRTRSQEIVEVEDQPIIVDGTNWDENAADTALTIAKAFWFTNAKINIRTLPIKHISDFSVNTTGDVLKRALEAAGVTSKHITMFLKDAGRIDSFGSTLSPQDLPPGFPYRGVSFISSWALRGYVIAHEWGHSFGLDHWDGIGNIMAPLPVPFLTFPGLSPWQESRARDFAKNSF